MNLEYCPRRNHFLRRVQQVMCWALVYSAASPAMWAMMPCSYFVKARTRAAAHLQVKLVDVSATRPSCTVRGEIIRVFRAASKRFEVGKLVTFDVLCANPGDGTPGPSADLYTLVPDLKRAQWLEVFLNETGNVVADSVGIIAAPSSEPVCSPDEKCLCYGSLTAIP